MIPVEIYSTVYYITISIFTCFFCFRFYILGNKAIANKSINDGYCFVLLLIVILFIGLRDPYGSHHYFGDTGAYTRMYNNVNNPFYTVSKDLGFYYIVKFLSNFNSLPLFYTVCACLYILPVYHSLRKWFSEKAIIALIIYVTSMSFWAFGINGVRNGLAVSFFIFALSFLHKRFLMLLLMLLSISLHKSILLPVIIFFSTYWIKNTKILIVLWAVCVVVNLIIGRDVGTSINPLMEIMDEDRGRSYIYLIDQLTDFVSDSFRLDFLIYSFIPIICAYYFLYKKNYEDLFYQRIVNTYIIVNAIWILFFMYVPFTSRFAFLSWFLMPIILIYPLLKEQLFNNQNKKIISIIILNLLFTLIMFFK